LRKDTRDTGASKNGSAETKIKSSEMLFSPRKLNRLGGTRKRSAAIVSARATTVPKGLMKNCTPKRGKRKVWRKGTLKKLTFWNHSTKIDSFVSYYVTEQRRKRLSPVLKARSERRDKGQYY